MTTATATGFDALRTRQNAAIRADQPAHQERLTWNRTQIEAHQRTALRDLLAHAAEHSPFHAERLAGIDPASIEPTDLSQLPVMTKAQMMDALDDVYTDRRLTAAMVEDALAATRHEPVPILDDYTAYTSGGSSGRRGTFVFDERAMRQLVGALSRTLLARFQALGGPPPGGIPIGYVAAASAVHLTGSAPAWTAGGDLGFRYIGLPVTRPLPELVERLNALQVPVLAGYPSMLARLALEQRAGRLRIAPMAVSVTSELLTPDTRALIRDTFGVPIVNGFASTEGLMGTSGPDDEAITFAEDGCIVELVDDENRPVPPGTPSAKVLVTSLENHLQPLIRYELNDRFCALPVSDGYLRAVVDGRADDVLRYGDVTVHPLVIRSVLVQCPGITEYQVHQTPRGVDVALVAAEDVDLPGLCAHLEDALATTGLRAPEARARLVPALKRNPATGKLRRFVPLP